MMIKQVYKLYVGNELYSTYYSLNDLKEAYTQAKEKHKCLFSGKYAIYVERYTLKEVLSLEDLGLK